MAAGLQGLYLHRVPGLCRGSERKQCRRQLDVLATLLPGPNHVGDADEGW